MVGARLSCRGAGRPPSRPLLPNWQRAQVGGNHLSGGDKARSGHSATRAPSESVHCPASGLLPPSGIRHIPLMTGVVPQEAHLLLLPLCVFTSLARAQGRERRSKSAHSRCVPTTSVS